MQGFAFKNLEQDNTSADFVRNRKCAFISSHLPPQLCPLLSNPMKQPQGDGEGGKSVEATRAIHSATCSNGDQGWGNRTWETAMQTALIQCDARVGNFGVERSRIWELGVTVGN